VDESQIQGCKTHLTDCECLKNLRIMYNDSTAQKSLVQKGLKVFLPSALRSLNPLMNLSFTESYSIILTG
jgi:hypothetical protein